MANLTVSAVVFDTELREIQFLLDHIRGNKCIKSWVVVDNGSSDEIRDAVRGMGGIYIRPGKNLGFGGGHNLALKHLAGVDAPYHLILNPDIVFDGDALGKLVDVMDSHPDVGLVMPKVLYPDGSNQYLCKLLPAPIDLVLRRFLPRHWKDLARKRTALYELRFLDSDEPAYVPSLSGCFMFVRRSVLETVGGFDERFFLYMEDVDLCRRILGVSRLLYWPRVTVEHGHQMGSYRNRKLLFLHIRSAIQYFNKWGWFNDAKRIQINRATLVSRGQLPRS
ncbi:MAG TPA: glycosyltransferase family 2 protein [Acidobacteriaceae bacterium]|nr:glycosyltransferase family 2 protein [Acidobacteriaceae bacterium]